MHSSSKNIWVSTGALSGASSFSGVPVEVAPIEVQGRRAVEGYSIVEQGSRLRALAACRPRE